MKSLRSVFSGFPRRLSVAFTAAALLVLASVSLAADGQPTGNAPATIESQVDAMVAKLLASGKLSTRGVERSVPTAFEGVAWETGEGVNVGTSRLGVQVNQAIMASLASRGVPSEAAGVTSRGLGRVLHGSFKVLNTGLSLSLALVDAGTGMKVSKVAGVLRTSLALAGNDNVLPPNADKWKPLIRLVNESIKGSTGPFRVAVSTTRGRQAAFDVGDPLQIVVSADRDCYLRLYHVSWDQIKSGANPSLTVTPSEASQTFTLVFPNKAHHGSFIRKGDLLTIPAESTGVRFVVQEPTGVDAIVALACERPFGDEAALASAWSVESRDIPSGQSRGVASVGPYLVARNVSRPAARNILTRGLLMQVDSPDGEAPGKVSAADLLNASDRTSLAAPSTSAAEGATSPAANPPATSPSSTDPPATSPPGTSPPATSPSASVQPAKTGESLQQAQSKPLKLSSIARSVCFFTTLKPR